MLYLMVTKFQRWVLFFIQKPKDPRNIHMNLLIVQISSLYLHNVTTLSLQIAGKYSFHVVLLSICVFCFNVSF